MKTIIYNLKINKFQLLFNILLVTLFINFLSTELFSTSIESKSGKKFENILITENNNNFVEFIDQDGIISRINKSAIKNINEDKPNQQTEKIPSPPIPKNNSEYTLLFSQSLANDGAFQGSSLFGERQARRNNQKYREFSQAWNLASSIELLGLPKNFQIGLTLLNPLVDRTNVDSDQYYQASPGGQNQTSLLLKSLNSGSLQYDPNSIKLRNERNGLIDYLFSRINYEHPTAFGSFGIGFIFINANSPIYVMRSLYIISYRPPFLQYFNPLITINNRMSYETSGSYQTAGLYQGIHNYRLSFSHEYFQGEKFRFTPSIVMGYQDINNNVDQKRGISDISPRLQFNYLNYFLAFNYMMRIDSYLSDTQYYYPNIGTYPDSNPRDEVTTNPSKVNGLYNAFIIDTIKNNVSNDYIKQYLIEKYQHQKILNGIFFFNIGYSARF